jgi:hypothetical protein
MAVMVATGGSYGGDGGSYGGDGRDGGSYGRDSGGDYGGGDYGYLLLIQNIFTAT